jgi:ABC-type nitrate/sulfonate/bicarbonate transport system permease component
MKYALAGMSLGLCFGAAWGAALHNVALGIALGVALGIPCGLVFSGSSTASTRKTLASDKPSPYPLGL